MARKKQTKQPKPRKPIKRTTRHFQLRTEHPKDAHVLEVLTYLRGQRREVTVIRDAIALYWALENNSLDMLFDLFPQYRAKFPPTSGDSGGGQLDEIRGMLELIASQQKAGSSYLMSSAAAPAKAQPATDRRALGVAPSMPNFEDFEDDDQPTVLVRASTNTDSNSSLNFVTALRGMM